VRQSGAGQVFSEYSCFPCNRRSLHRLLHNHPHVSSGECTIGQCGRSAGTYRDLRDLKQRDLRNLNLGDLKRDLSPTPQKTILGLMILFSIPSVQLRVPELISVVFLYTVNNNGHFHIRIRFIKGLFLCVFICTL
jgi:hypothetical protein